MPKPHCLHLNSNRKWAPRENKSWQASNVLWDKGMHWASVSVPERSKRGFRGRLLRIPHSHPSLPFNWEKRRATWLRTDFGARMPGFPRGFAEVPNSCGLQSASHSKTGTLARAGPHHARSEICPYSSISGFREVKSLAWGHTAKKQRRQNLHMGNLLLVPYSQPQGSCDLLTISRELRHRTRMRI